MWRTPLEPAGAIELVAWEQRGVPRQVTSSSKLFFVRHAGSQRSLQGFLLVDVAMATNGMVKPMRARQSDEGPRESGGTTGGSGPFNPGPVGKRRWRHALTAVAPRPDKAVLVAMVAATLLAPGAGAGTAHAHGSVHRAVAELDHRIDATPDDAELYLKRGRLYLDQGHARRAIADFGRALRRDPSLRAARYFRANARLTIGRLGAAEADARAFLDSLDESNRGGRMRGHLLLGEILAARGRLRPAAEQFRLGLALAESPRPDDVLALADVLARDRRAIDAIAALDAAQASLGSVVALERRALQLERSTGRRDAALTRIERLARTSPVAAPWLYERATLLSEAGDIVGARGAASQALVSLAALPPGRRKAPAWQQLEADLRELVASLPADGARATARRR